MGAVALGFRWTLAALSSRRLSPAYHDSVSHPRSSNRTCGSPASGFPTGFTLRHTSNDNFQLMPATTTCAEFRLRLEVKLSLESPNFFGVCRPMANHLILSPSKAYQKQGPFPPPALPGFTGRTALSDSRPGQRLMRRCGSRPRTRDGPPTVLKPPS